AVPACKTFRATSLPVEMSRARNTSPMPPLPAKSSTRKRPATSVPRRRVMECLSVDDNPPKAPPAAVFSSNQIASGQILAIALPPYHMSPAPDPPPTTMNYLHTQEEDGGGDEAIAARGSYVALQLLLESEHPCQPGLLVPLEGIDAVRIGRGAKRT